MNDVVSQLQLFTRLLYKNYKKNMARKIKTNVRLLLFAVDNIGKTETKLICIRYHS